MLLPIRIVQHGIFNPDTVFVAIGDALRTPGKRIGFARVLVQRIRLIAHDFAVAGPVHLGLATPDYFANLRPILRRQSAHMDRGRGFHVRVVDAAQYSIHFLQRVHTVIEFDVVVGFRVCDCALAGKADEFFDRGKRRSSLSLLPDCFPDTQGTSHNQGDDESTLHGLSLDRAG